MIKSVNTRITDSEICKLEELVSFKRGKNITSLEMIDGKIPVVSAGIEYSGYHNEWNVKGPSITISSSGANAGIVLFHNYDFWAADCLYAYKSNNYIFSYYFLKYLQPVIFNLQRGSAQPHVYAKNVNRLYVAIPDDKERCLIGKALNNYDRLIENNNKRIKLLEDMAESLYKEWFVRFRFPGHETTEFQNGIPADWEYKKFSEVCSYTRGLSYSSNQIEKDDAPNLLINLKNLRDYGGFRKDNFKTYDGDFKKKQVVTKFDLVMAVTEMVQERRIIGYVGLIPTYNRNCVISADLIKLESDIDNLFLYSMFTFGGASLCFSQYGNGTNVIHLKPGSLRNIKLLVPSLRLIEWFVKIVKNNFEIIDCLEKENELLTKQRDSLLPRLMSGKLSVEGKEIV